ncbi:juvenile hormone acid O-methyltransferase isoform X3 [Rhipicephalus microplus]|uniref:juvenile hormone acid O-methyltransferase isoform X3 n=1 Tax=Rhipicephalus microplus TaxID=6941 RepID=UPI003F6B7CAD
MAATVRACSKRVFSRSSGHTAQRSRSLLPSIATTMWASWLSKESTKAIVRLQPAWSLDTGAYESLKPWVHAENLRALDAVRFSQPAIHADQQYLDVGCGSGSFTKEALLPRVRPECRRIVAVDRCKKVLHDARENFSDEHIVYDTMDIENHDPGSLTERYGAFDRVYSFLTFHYVADITKAYGNVCKLLKQGGECLVLSVVKADAIDVWNEVYQMEEWNALIINPASLFPGMVHSDSAIRSAEQLEAHTRESISTAGLHCLTYYRYNSRWVFRRMEDYVDAFMSSFKAHNGVPPEKQSTLRDVWIDLFQKKTHVGLGREFPVTYSFSIVHARKPYYS